MRDFAFYNAGCHEPKGWRRCVVLPRRLIRRLLRPVFLRQVELFEQLDSDLAALARKQEQIRAFGWDYVALVRRVAALEDRIERLQSGEGLPVPAPSMPAANGHHRNGHSPASTNGHARSESAAIPTFTRVAAERRVRDRVPTAMQDVFDRYVRGKSFADLGCMWETHAAYAYYAEMAGAVAPILAVDEKAETPTYEGLHRALESRVRFHRKDIMTLDPAVDGMYDVVFCSGVLYHAPDPMQLLARVFSLAHEMVILVTHTISGDEPKMVLYPYSPHPEPFPWEERHGRLREHRFQVQYGCYDHWWFGFTEPCVENMLRCFGAEVVESYRYVNELEAGSPLNPQITTFVTRLTRPVSTPRLGDRLALEV